MARPKKAAESLTPLELKVMQALWSEAPCTVQAVHAKLEPALAFTTVQTVLNVLHQKGRVRRKLQGRAYEYRPVESKDSVLGQAVHDMVRRMFGGSSEDLVMSLIKTRVSVNLIWPTCDALIWPTLDPICYPDEMVSDSRLARPERSPVPREAGNWA